MFLHFEIQCLITFDGCLPKDVSCLIVNVVIKLDCYLELNFFVRVTIKKSAATSYLKSSQPGLGMISAIWRKRLEARTPSPGAARPCCGSAPASELPENNAP